MGHRVGERHMNFDRQDSGIPGRVERHHNMERKLCQQV